ncbi:MAG: glycosyltransferase [Desulfobacterales bacterium]|nr:glycosyltransferase [Desulfobacterales bacterium]
MTTRNFSKKIKIAFIIDTIHGIKAGTETQLNLLINYLDKNKYEIHLLCLRETEWMKENNSTLNCKVCLFKVNSIINPMSILSYIKVIRHVQNIKPDIVMTFFRDSNIIGVIAACLANVKVIISTRRDYGLWLDRRTHYVLGLANKFVKGIVANSRKVKELTCKEEIVDCSKTHVIYNGIKFGDVEPVKFDNELLKNKLGIPSDNQIVGIVANLRPMKRYKTFINAAKHVLLKNPNVHFVIVGDGQLRNPLENLALELGIRDYIHFVGSQEDVLPYLSIFDIGINCSANEGLSNAIMEYMDFGIPCIVSAAGGNEELIENGINGYTFILDDYSELARLIIDLIDDDTKKKTFIIKSKEWVKANLNIDKMINEYDRYFTMCYENTGKQK